MENQRIRLSKAMLKNGLLELLSEKPLQKITISEICNKSEINRTTFYKYYGSQQDLLDDICKDFLNDIENGLTQLAFKQGEALTSTLTIFYSHRDTFKILVSAYPQKVFADTLFTMPVINAIFDNLSKHSSFSQAELPYVKQFIFQGVFALITNWLCSDNPEPVSEIAPVLIKLRDKLYDGKVVFDNETI